MKTSLDHLPPGKRNKLRAIAKAIRDTVEVEMIIVFGSYARGDYVEDPSTPAERQAFARECFDRYAERADRRYGLFETALSNDWYNEAAFELHQVAESCYKAVQLVFTAYLPKTHKLEALGKKCGDLHPAFREVFPTATPEDRGRFELLEAAYVDARYSMTYAITRADLDTLAAHVRELRARVEHACLERIAAMASG